MVAEPSANLMSRAEIQFPQFGMKEQGVIIKMDTQVIGLRVLDKTTPLSKIVRGETGEVVFTLRGILHRFHVVHLSFQENVLLLGIGNVLRGPQLRGAERIDMAFRVSWRALRENSSHGSWRSGLTQDVSMTGAKIIIPPVIDIPNEMEALIYIDEEVKESVNYTLDRLNYVGGRVSSEPPVRARGKARHAAQLPDGRVALGVQFTRLTDVDKVRLQNCLLESQSMKRGGERG